MPAPAPVPASTPSRDRLVRLVRRADADLAEAALLCCVEVEPGLDVDATLLRVDALADGLLTSGFAPATPTDAARGLAHHLAAQRGFTGDVATYNDPDNGLLTRVLERRRGLPITLAILYVAVARRLDVPAYVVNLPGHVVAAIAGDERPVVLDPFADGRLVDETELQARIAEASGGRMTFHRALLRPSPSAQVVRRLLNNLTRDLLAAGRPRDALWTVELKLLLPNRSADDHRVLGELLNQVGRFDEAADAFEAYLDLVDERARDREDVRRAAIRARARLN